MNSEELQVSFGRGKGWGKSVEDLQRVPEEAFKVAPRNSYEKVREFHEAFGHPVAEEPTAIADNRAELRLALILEEAIELAEAAGFDTAALQEAVSKGLERIEEPDVVGIADALGDLEYVVNGAALEHGINLPAVVTEIHRSNMTKLGPDGKPIYREDGKILKGEGYEPPRLVEVLGL